MIRSWLPGTSVPVEGPPPAEAVWIDLLNPTAEEEAMVEALACIDVPIAEEMAEIELSSRLYQEDGALFMTATLVSGVEAGDPVSRPVAFVLTPQRLITVRYSTPRAFAMFEARLARDPAMAASAVSVLAHLLDAVVDRLADTLEVAHADLDATARLVFRRDRPKGSPRRPISSEALADILDKVGHDHDLIAKTRESLTGLQRVLSYLSLSPTVRADKACREMFKTISRDILSLASQADALSENVSFLMDATLGLINVEQAGIIKIFSVAAVVFLPPTLVASIYGMNFDVMPELRWQFGYAWALGLMVLSAVVPYLLFKRKGWL
jgi:magnesium transporter